METQAVPVASCVYPAGDGFGGIGGSSMEQERERQIASVAAALKKPVDEARGLPARWYADPDHFALECDRLFKRTWMAVCFSDEIAGRGDLHPARIAGVEIVVVRAADGAARAYHNVCRHRAARVVSEPARGQAALRCPYHWWTYGLDGALRNAPYFDGTAGCRPDDAADLGLKPVRCGEWNGIVFVNIDGAAPALEDYVRPLAQRWAAFDTTNCPVFAMEQRTIPANWKIVMEGVLEVYHEHFIHKELTLRLTAEGAKTFEDIWEGEMMGFRSVVEEDKPDHPPMALPLLPGMPCDGTAPTEIFLLFPSVTMNILDNHFVRTIWTWDGPRQSGWKSTWQFAAGAADTDEGRALCRGVVDFWCDVRAEDLGAVNAVQAGIESRADHAVEIRYSPFWEPILLHFHRRIATGLAA